MSLVSVKWVQKALTMTMKESFEASGSRSEHLTNVPFPSEMNKRSSVSIESCVSSPVKGLCCPNCLKGLAVKENAMSVSDWTPFTFSSGGVEYAGDNLSILKEHRTGKWLVVGKVWFSGCLLSDCLLKPLSLSVEAVISDRLYTVLNKTSGTIVPSLEPFDVDGLLTIHPSYAATSVLQVKIEYGETVIKRIRNLPIHPGKQIY